MFHHKKSRILPVLFAFFCSFLLHAPLLYPHKSLKSALARAQMEENDDNLVLLVEYPDHQQIVHQKNFNKIIPKKQTYYLSQADKAVEKETQAMLQGLFYQARELGVSAEERGGTKSVERKISSSKEELILQDKIKAPISLDLSEMEVQKGFFQKRKTGKQNVSQTMDFLPGVERGSHTLLNTREFIYYTFFARMKEQLYWRWTQYIKKELLAPLSFNGFSSKYKQKHFFTHLYIYLSPEGEIQDMRVVKSSGVELIDSAALHAFLLAEPFPNPPTGLIEEDGYIHIRQVFHLFLGSSSLL